MDRVDGKCVWVNRKVGLGAQKTGAKRGFGLAEVRIMRVLPFEKAVWGCEKCAVLRIFALEGGVFLRRSARFFVFLRGSVLKGVFFLDW